MNTPPEEGTTPPLGGNIVVSPVPLPLTVQYSPRSVTMHTVSGEELDSIAALGNSIHWSFFGLCVGGLISFMTVLTTTIITTPATHEIYVALAAACGIFSFYFGIRGFMDFQTAKKKLADIKCGRQG